MVQNLLLATLGTHFLAKEIKKHAINSVMTCDVVYEPIMNVSIIIPTLNEEDNVQMMLESIINQSIIQMYPKYFEIILIDSNSSDRTIEIAKPYVDRIIIVGKGKLNARHIATEKAIGKIIISVDADTFYPPNWLNKMLYYYNDENVVAVCGNRYFADANNVLYEQIYDIYMSLIRSSHKRICGGNSSYLKEAYYQVNGFDLNINQQCVKQMIQEEEILFYHKLSQLGKIINTTSLPVITSDRHLIRNLNECHTNPQYCQDVLSGERF